MQKPAPVTIGLRVSRVKFGNHCCDTQESIVKQWVLLLEHIVKKQCFEFTMVQICPNTQELSGIIWVQEWWKKQDIIATTT
jgi:hypothetical protein